MTELQVIEDAVRANLAASAGDACRLFHGRGKAYPGLEHVVVDYFQPLLLVTLFAEVSQAWLAQLASVLATLGEPHGISAIAVQHRYQAGMPLQHMWGEVPHKPVAREQGLTFALQLGGRQNLGFFLDMAEARNWLRARASGKRLLNLFAYTCAFSVVARAAGALEAVNLDMSAAALRQGQQNHQRNAVPGGTRYLAHDLFRSWSKLEKLGPYDLVVVDPPSRQPGSFVAEKDYARVLARLPALCAPGAEILICLNSPHVEAKQLQAWVAESAPQLEFVSRLPNPVQFPDASPELSLKVLAYRLSDNR